RRSRLWQGTSARHRQSRAHWAHSYRTASALVITKGCRIRMSSRRSGRGEPISQERWPASGARRAWLAFCDQVHQANGMPSLGALAAAMGLASRSRVGELLRGLALPADEDQARALLGALGAVGAELDRGIRRYRAARAEQDQAARRAD